jgi:type IX secretion system PorP/SprF family membrane protein
VSFAQQDPLLSQYMHLPTLFNPAAVGAQEKIQFGALVRRQWTQVRNAPGFNGISADMPFNYSRMGVGINILQESIVADNKLSVQALYAYKINLSTGKLAFGMNIGIVNYRFDASKIAIKDEDDHLIGNGFLNSTQPDLGFGFFYTSQLWDAGLSVSHLFKHKLGYFNELLSHATIDRQVFGYVKLKFKMHENWELWPSVMMRSARTPNLSQAEINGTFLYREELWMGVGYRTRQAVLFQAGLKLGRINKSLQDIRIGYNYDLTFAEATNFFGPTHEIVFRALFDMPKNRETIYKKPKAISPFDL